MRCEYRLLILASVNSYAQFSSWNGILIPFELRDAVCFQVKSGVSNMPWGLDLARVSLICSTGLLKGIGSWAPHFYSPRHCHRTLFHPCHWTLCGGCCRHGDNCCHPHALRCIIPTRSPMLWIWPRIADELDTPGVKEIILWPFLVNILVYFALWEHCCHVYCTTANKIVLVTSMDCFVAMF